MKRTAVVSRDVIGGSPGRRKEGGRIDRAAQNAAWPIRPGIRLASANHGNVIGDPLVVRHAILPAIATVGGGSTPKGDLVEICRAVGFAALIAKERVALASGRDR